MEKRLAGLAAVLVLGLPLSSGHAAEPEKPPLPRCESGASFKTLAWLVRHAKPGRVAVRGRVWRGTTARCTKSDSSDCVIFLVLGPRAPRQDEWKGFVTLDGDAGAGRFACTRADDGPVTCPVKGAGEQLGVEGDLTIEEADPAPMLFLNVARVCRF